MKLSSKLHRQIEIKIRRSLAAETQRTETTSLPDRGAITKPRDPEGSANR
jgi:hypothetical protein